MRALRPGLARKATWICRYRTTTSRPHRMRKTIIRTRKIRGEESLRGSSCLAMARRKRVVNQLKSTDNMARARRTKVLPRNEISATPPLASDSPVKPMRYEGRPGNPVTTMLFTSGGTLLLDRHWLRFGRGEGADRPGPNRRDAVSRQFVGPLVQCMTGVALHPMPAHAM